MKFCHLVALSAALALSALAVDNPVNPPPMMVNTIKAAANTGQVQFNSKLHFLYPADASALAVELAVAGGTAGVVSVNGLTGVVTLPVLSATGVTAAAYGTASSVGSFTVDANGRLTAAANTSISIPASAISNATLIGRGIMMMGNPNAETYIKVQGDNVPVLRSRSQFLVTDLHGADLAVGNVFTATGNKFNAGLEATSINGGATINLLGDGVVNILSRVANITPTDALNLDSLAVQITSTNAMVVGSGASITFDAVGAINFNTATAFNIDPAIPINIGTITLGTWNGDPIVDAYIASAAGWNAKQGGDSDLTALAGNSSNGLWARTGTGTGAARTLVAGSSKISISNGDGVSGNPSFDVVDANLSMTGMSGVVGPTHGGTGFSAYAIGDILLADTTSTLAKLPDVAIGNVLLSQGVGVAPAYGKVTTAHTTGIAESGANTSITSVTLTGGSSSSFAGSASTAAMIWTGALYTAGSATTTFPVIFHQPTGTTAKTDWSFGSNNGTIYGANESGSFNGNYADFALAGVTKFKVTANGGVTVGTTLNTGGAATLASIVGQSTLTNAGLLTATGGMVYGIQRLTGAGAINLTTGTTALTSSGAGQALTLANGTDGQIKTIVHDVDGGSMILTPTTKTGFSTVTFTNVGETVTLQYFTTRGWMVIGSYLTTIAP